MFLHPPVILFKTSSVHWHFSGHYLPQYVFCSCLNPACLSHSLPTSSLKWALLLHEWASYEIKEGNINLHFEMMEQLLLSNGCVQGPSLNFSFPFKEPRLFSYVMYYCLLSTFCNSSTGSVENRPPWHCSSIWKNHLKKGNHTHNAEHIRLCFRFPDLRLGFSA